VGLFGQLDWSPGALGTGTQIKLIKTRNALCRPGAVARIESSADLGSRFTMTRLAAFGIVGWGSKKRIGSFFLTIEQDGAIVFFQEVQHHRKRDEAGLRKRVAQFNMDAEKQPSRPHESTP
jgi:hypothetical protein